jgi:hypothetical protein
MNASPRSASIACAATATASIPLPQSLFTVQPGTSTGKPASNELIRATLRVVLARLVGAPKVDVVDGGGLEPSAVDRGAEDERREVVGPNSGEGAAVATHRGAHGLDYHCGAHSAFRHATSETISPACTVSPAWFTTSTR